jgi:transposase-like protein
VIGGLAVTNLIAVPSEMITILTVTNESIRRCVLKFGPIIARNLRDNRPKPYTRWHLDEMVVSIAGRQMYMWRAVDSEGEVLEILVQPQRDKVAALRLLCKLLRHQGFVPTVIVTHKLRSYGAALREIGFSGSHEQGLRANNRGELASAGSTTRTKDACGPLHALREIFARIPRSRIVGEAGINRLSPSGRALLQDRKPAEPR